MEFIKPGTHIDFIGKRKISLLLSATFILIGIISLIAKGGPKYGIDFAGGTLVQLQFREKVSIGRIRDGLKRIDLGDSVIQEFGSDRDILIRLEKSTTHLEGFGEQIKKALEEEFPPESFQVMRIEMVGPKIGKELRRKGIWAIFLAMFFILIYISYRFEFKFAVGAVIALAHDVLIIIGVFSITNKEFTLPIIAAILAIIGYSLNDTIVVFDRIREDLRRIGKETYESIINMSINETLSRTILTSITTLTVVVALFFLGGEVIHDFAFAMIVGIIVGTYSSIFVASPILVIWGSELKLKKRK